MPSAADPTPPPAPTDATSVLNPGATSGASRVPARVPQSTVDLVMPVYKTLAAYHDYEVRGLSHVPDSGRALIVFTHSLATYDIILFGARLFLEKDRLIASLGDRAIFRTPLLRELASHLSAVQGEPSMARALLAEGRLVGVAPGGMREALRPSRQKYQLDWAGRTGFARLALETQTPVILAACPAADDLYEVSDNPLTRFVYERFRLPLPVATGRLGPIPHKVKLLHLVSEPLVPPPIAAATASDAEARAFFDVLEARMTALIAEALAARG